MICDQTQVCDRFMKKGRARPLISHIEVKNYKIKRAIQQRNSGDRKKYKKKRDQLCLAAMKYLCASQSTKKQQQINENSFSMNFLRLYRITSGIF